MLNNVEILVEHRRIIKSEIEEIKMNHKILFEGAIVRDIYFSVSIYNSLSRAKKLKYNKENELTVYLNAKLDLIKDLLGDDNINRYRDKIDFDIDYFSKQDKEM